jgi:predicted nuclease of restriction endonuclease-like RecB superfamily
MAWKPKYRRVKQVPVTKDITCRSEFEASIVRDLLKKGVPFQYEPFTIPYVKHHKYKPDVVLSNGIYVEIKGFWEPEDRAKHRLIQAQHPDLDVRFVFMNAKKKIGKTHTYASWCDRWGFKWAEKSIPASWLKERGKKA